MAPSQDTDPAVLQKRLRLAHQARRAKEHQLDDIRRALCDIGFMEDDDPYSHADLADVIRQNGHALTNQPAAQTSYPLTSPEWRPGEGHERCPFRMSTGDGRLQCTFRDGHPPHGHALNATNPGTPEPDTEVTARVFAGLHRSAEKDVSRVIALYENWEKIVPPSADTSLSHWWSARLAELHDAILPPVREQKGRPTHPDGTPYSYAEMTAEGWEHCDGCRMWSTGTPQRPHQCPETHISGPAAGGA
ncbi:hypothetical protein [Streptomyces sp. PU_AKi4]|uniref:hypothetical protein n=1 Tax=Streptomyces sp. PU_AKi4 TaxID=2800809 RepID=UPI003525917F